MRECKILCFHQSSLKRSVKSVAPGQSMCDFPTIEREVDAYLAQGYSVKNITCINAGDMFIYLER